MSTLVHIFLYAAGVYACAGLFFALPFVLMGAPRLTAAAHGATWGFRLIILPGVIALWPWLAMRWWRGAAPEERTAHRTRASRPTHTA